MANKQIISLIKQNDGMYKGLCNKNIVFERTNITDNVTEEEHLALLQAENQQLKIIVQEHKAPSQPKKIKIVDTVPINEIPKVKEIVYPTYTNLENMKRAFFGNNYESYLTMVRKYPFKFYKASYKYNDDNDGKQSYVATNLLKGIVRNYEKMSKYAMLVFRCWSINDKYQYDSFWMLNSEIDIKIIAKDAYEDFIFEDIDMETFDTNFRRKSEGTIEDNRTMLAETYIH